MIILSYCIFVSAKPICFWKSAPIAWPPAGLSVLSVMYCWNMFIVLIKPSSYFSLHFTFLSYGNIVNVLVILSLLLNFYHRILSSSYDSPYLKLDVSFQSFIEHFNTRVNARLENMLLVMNVDALSLLYWEIKYWSCFKDI